MVDPDRRPTAQEIEELIDLVRRDPASPAFVELGDAYLALGRPRDALQVGAVGLEASPDSLDGRVMVARAYASIHQWKEAQGELLRVVKVDRANRQGFALLGEVLLRRNDYERAVPVLQHAQNLDPTSPSILAMLKRARAGQSLDPPPPPPSPVPPRGETDNGQPIIRSRAAVAPTVPAGRARPGPSRPPPPPMGQPMVPVASPAMPTLAIEPTHDWRNEPATEHAPPPAFAPAFADASSPVSATAATMPSPTLRPPKPAAPPPPQQLSVEGVRPRLVQSAKPQNAAAASLRQSAAVGEGYLNELLTGGLLDVAGVRVPDADFDLRPDRRWGRSTRRAFIFLFVVLVLGIGGGGTWYWWSEKQKAEEVARLEHESQVAITPGDFVGLEACIDKLGQALKKDSKGLLTYAYFAECSGLEALLYGTDADRVDVALRTAKDIKDDEPGARELLIGRAAVELSRLTGGEGAQATAVATVSKTTLGEVRKSLDNYLTKHAGDHDKDKESKEKWRWIQWLRGRAQLAAGERHGGRAMIKEAADGDDGLIVAMIDLADLLVDDGQLDEALTTYDKANARAKDHPLIIVGRSLGRAEASVKNEETIGELSVKLSKDLPARLSSYRHLATALANLDIEAYASAADSLRKATAQRPPNEPRFWARIAWAQLVRGDIAAAATIADSKIVWFGTAKPEEDPTTQLVKAGLSLVAGRPEKALTIAGQLQGVRPQLVRAHADLDLGKPGDARKEAEDVLKSAPDNLEAKIVREQGRAIGSDGKERADALDALSKLATQAKSKLGYHALGMAYYALGDYKEAQPALEKALANISDDSPNPLIYRTRTALAEVLLANGDIPGAGEQIDNALKVNPAYFPTRQLQAKVVLRINQPERALELLKPLRAEFSPPPPTLDMLYAEAMATRKGVTPKEKDEAIELLKSLKDKVPAADLSHSAAAIDPKLVKEMGLPEPTAAPGSSTTAPADAAKPPCDKRKHRCN